MSAIRDDQANVVKLHGNKNTLLRANHLHQKNLLAKAMAKLLKMDDEGAQKLLSDPLAHELIVIIMRQINLAQRFDRGETSSISESKIKFLLSVNVGRAEKTRKTAFDVKPNEKKEPAKVTDIRPPQKKPNLKKVKPAQPPAKVATETVPKDSLLALKARLAEGQEEEKTADVMLNGKPLDDKPSMSHDEKHLAVELRQKHGELLPTWLYHVNVEKVSGVRGFLYSAVRPLKACIDNADNLEVKESLKREMRELMKNINAVSEIMTTVHGKNPHDPANHASNKVYNDMKLRVLECDKLGKFFDKPTAAPDDPIKLPLAPSPAKQEQQRQKREERDAFYNDVTRHLQKAGLEDKKELKKIAGRLTNRCFKDNSPLSGMDAKDVLAQSAVNRHFDQINRDSDLGTLDETARLYGSAGGLSEEEVMVLANKKYNMQLEIGLKAADEHKKKFSGHGRGEMSKKAIAAKQQGRSNGSKK